MKNQTEIEKALDNMAEVKNAEEILCDNCSEQVIFLLKDKDHEFSLGLETVLDCLFFAIKNGNLPKLPLSWLHIIDGIYDTTYSFNDKLGYYDYNVQCDKLDDEYLKEEKKNKTDKYIKHFKLEAKKNAERFEISHNNFEKQTQNKFPFLQRNENGDLSQYAICPSCLNPIQLNGLMVRTKKFPLGVAVHTGKDIKGLGKWNEDNYKKCPYKSEI